MGDNFSSVPLDLGGGGKVLEVLAEADSGALGLQVGGWDGYSRVSGDKLHIP